MRERVYALYLSHTPAYAWVECDCHSLVHKVWTVDSVPGDGECLWGRAHLCDPGLHWKCVEPAPLGY